MKRKGKTLLFEAYYIYDLDIMRQNEKETETGETGFATENIY